MNIVNENVIVKILNSYHANAKNLKIEHLKWELNTKIIAAGNNFSSEVYRLIVEYQTEEKAQKSVFFIRAPCNCLVYEMMSKVGMYVKEAIMYIKILPQIYTFEEEYFTARNYYVDEKNSLFLEDLSQSGYRIADRIQQLDFQHCVLALKSLAKLHALSVHLERTSGLPEIIRENPLSQTDHMRIAVEVGQTNFYNHLDPSIQEKYAEKIKFFKKIDWALAMDDLKPENSSFNVLNHGDYWTGNIMFKYDKHGAVEKCKMIDFQLCHWGNPAADLVYFAIHSIRYDVYSKHFHSLCTIYLDTLNKILDNFGYRSYEMEELEKDIEARYAYAIANAICILPVTASNHNSPFDLNEAVKNEEYDLTVAQKAYGQKHYMELGTKWFLNFAQKDLPEFEHK